MTIFDYILGDNKECMTFDEAGNLYMKYTPDLYEFTGIVIAHHKTDGGYFLTKEEYDRLCGYEIILPDNGSYDTPDARRPYYRMRGKPVTKEQAFDIVRRTDNFFAFIYTISAHEDFVEMVNFDNWLIYKNHCPAGYGWIHVDGTVGCNAITQKYPEEREFICEWLKCLIAFPYIDLVIALTDWDEVPHYYESDINRDNFQDECYDNVFYEEIVCGIYVHDKTVQILGKSETVEKYKEYDALYGKDRDKFLPEYYEKHNIEQVDMAYLKKCIESFGFNADEILAKESEYTWKRE